MIGEKITLYYHNTNIYNRVSEVWDTHRGSPKRTCEGALEEQRILLIRAWNFSEESRDRQPCTQAATRNEVVSRFEEASVPIICTVRSQRIPTLPEERGLLPQYLTQAEMDLVDNMYVYNEVPEEEKNDQIYEICNILTLKQMDAIGIVRTGSAGINKRYTTETSDVRDMLYLAFLSLVNAYIQVKLREPNAEK